MTDLPTPDFARNMRLIGYCDQGGRPDGVQIMVERGFAYIGHMFSKGFSVIDVRDPRAPRPAGYIAAPPGTWNIHLQVHGDLLLVINAKDMFAEAAFADERAYYRGQIGTVVGTADAAATAREWTAGLAVYDISTPGAPRRIGFMAIEGGGIHRIWYTGGRWAYDNRLRVIAVFGAPSAKDGVSPLAVRARSSSALRHLPVEIVAHRVATEEPLAPRLVLTSQRDAANHPVR